MAKGKITVSGIKQIKDDLSMFVESLPEVSVEAIGSALKPVENRMKSNARSLFTKTDDDGRKYSTGKLANSISSIARIDSMGRPSGMVGVFHMPNKTGEYERVTATLLAYWYEFGIKPHSLSKGSRTERAATPGNPRGVRAKGQELGGMHPGSPPMPFMSSAFDGSLSQITKDITVEIDKEVDKL